MRREVRLRVQGRQREDLKEHDGFQRARAHKVYVEKKKHKEGEPQQTLLDQLDKWPTQSANTRAVTEDLAKAIALDKRPVSLVDGDGFSAWLNKYLPRYPVPAHVTIAAKIDEIGGGFVAFLKEIVSAAPGYALTTDGWTSDAGHFYRCQTVHFSGQNRCDCTVLFSPSVCAAVLLTSQQRFWWPFWPDSTWMLESASLSRQTAVRWKLLRSDWVSLLAFPAFVTG